MKQEDLKILQLGKFYPIRGGVEKVMYDLMLGLSARKVDCDMLCALDKGDSQIIPLNEHARLIGSPSWAKIAATMISPAMILTLTHIAQLLPSNSLKFNHPIFQEALSGALQILT